MKKENWIIRNESALKATEGGVQPSVKQHDSGLVYINYSFSFKDTTVVRNFPMAHYQTGDSQENYNLIGGSSGINSSVIPFDSFPTTTLNPNNPERLIIFQMNTFVVPLATRWFIWKFEYNYLFPIRRSNI